MGVLGKVLLLEQFFQTAVPFPWCADWMDAFLDDCNQDQKQRFARPVVRGEKHSCFAQTEPNAGSDPGGMMQTTAVRDGDHWIINGTKFFVSWADNADFALVQAVTDPENANVVASLCLSSRRARQDFRSSGRFHMGEQEARAVRARLR